LATFGRGSTAFGIGQPPAAPPPVPSFGQPVLVQPTLVEPLSERELEVLRLLAEGLSNQQIARQLIVAVGTVKTHIHNIYGKLNTQNRVQTIARAQELRLL
jgi:LuxR family maltose regulon positive regulatory protein